MMFQSDTQFGSTIDRSFFDRHPLDVARDLVGRMLVSAAGGVTVAGRIVETEAYLGSRDPGSHASTKGITARNAVMYGEPGSVYVYFTYGSHHMLNLVCEPKGIAGAVLIRALEPLAGVDIMTTRRRGRSLHELCNGPGKLAQALGVDLSDNGILLGEGRLQVYAGMRPPVGELAISGRVGLTNGHDLPYRIYEANNRFVSRGRSGPAPRRSRSDRSTEGSSR